MNAKEFVNELKRMLKVQNASEGSGTSICKNIKCSECPFFMKDKPIEYTHYCLLNFDYIEDVVDMVTEWSAEHPKLTYKDVLLKHFPNAKLNGDGAPKICPDAVGIIDDFECQLDCVACWNREYIID